jgi:hypothetical protein
MGTDIYLVLERRVPTAETVQARAALEAAQLPLPDDLVELCAPPEQHEWICVRYESWLELDDEGFRATAALFDAVYACVLEAGGWIEAEQRRRDPGYARCEGEDDEWWPTAVQRATTAARAALGLETKVTRSFGDVCADEPEAWLAPGGGFELGRRSYDRFALLSATARACMKATTRVLPCMREGVPDGCTAEQAGEHSFCWCALDALLATEWDVDGRRDAMGEACLLELDELGARIGDAGLRLSDFRLLVSFSS